MINHKFLNLVFSILIVASLLLSGSFSASAQKAQLPDSAGAAAPASPTDELKVPHYFGPSPNWANSPMTIPDAQVVITGNGSGAEAVAIVGADGAVTGITVTNGGSGYSSAKVDIIGSGSGASAKATIIKKGAVVGITVNSFGSGYTAPTVSFSGGGSGGGASATAYGRVDQVTITDGGLGYTFPTVDFDLPDRPGGIQAKGHAEMDANGTITAVIVDSPGSGYSTAPGVAIINGTRFDPTALLEGGRFATATTSLSITSIVVNTSGADYKTAPDVVISDPDGSGASATAALDNGVISAIDVTKPGSGYITPGGMRKFVDGLPMLCIPDSTAGQTFGDCASNNLGQHMPVAVPDTTTFPNTDYYVIALVQYREQMHSDLPPVVDPTTGARSGGTLLREYVQLETSAPEVSGVSKHVALQTDLVDGTSVPVKMPDGSPAIGVDDPHFLGPVIIAQKDRAVRITFYNLLPTGADGDLFMPVDSTFMGAGPGPLSSIDPFPNGDGTVMDNVRNQACSEYPKDGNNCFVDNRATLHLHGGITPWISDGTPHQWITPANENTPWPEGVSVGSVPDMMGVSGVPDCSADNDGCSTFYYTNQQSARLMFYHDHAWGITRLNVYAGEAAGYIITDETEQALVGDGIIPADQIPLVIQDRTFVPDDTQMYNQYDANGNVISYGQDPTWDKARWGGKGSLWYEHVYMPAQNPSDPSGMSAFGRWMYGPWFWPPSIDSKYQPIDNPYYDPACNLDDPATWQYDTDPFCEPPLIPGTPNNSAGMEQFNDTPIVNGTAYPTTTLEPKAYRFRILNAANDRFFNLQWYVADSTGTEVALNAAEVAAAQTDPNIFPTPDTALSPVGPSWIQIGTEGGFLPAPVVVPNQPITWITDPTRFDVGNVDQHSLLVAPAERADVVVDFSQYAGQTLILYNDAPAAFPARVASYDYYTGGPDLSPVGAPTTLPGYGPNTRTIMQVKINSGSGQAFDLNALKAAFRHHADGTGVFESGQHPIIVGQAAYNSAYGTSFAGAGWCNSPTAPSAKCDGFARISEQGGDLFKFDTLLGDQISIPLEPKAIHDEMNAASFDEFGRMTANLGLESVPATPGLQNILLYPYASGPTEIFDATDLPKNDITMTPVTPIAAADGTQIWKITHNGVDTHPIHWHLYDLQVLNRVTWDNIIIPPDANELGWKDTVRISPLEDTYVAIRPIIPYLPFEIPNSVRELNPMMPDGAPLDVGKIFDPQNNPIDVFNHLVNFGWEYVVHCHILSHEEMDMMRPVLIALPPTAPSGLQLVDNGDGTATLSWTDTSISETGFVVEKLVDGVWTQVDQQDRNLSDPNVNGEVLSYTDTSFFAGDQYRVAALNVVGDTWNYGAGVLGFPNVTTRSAFVTYADTSGVAAPSNLTATLETGPQASLAWQDNASNETGFVVERSDNGGAFSVLDTLGIDTMSYVDSTILPGNAYTYQVKATGSVDSAYSNQASVNVPALPAAPSDLSTTNVTETSLTLNWVNNELVNPVDGFNVQIATDSGFSVGLQEFTVAGDVTSLDFTGLTPGTTYYFQVAAFNLGGSSAWSAPWTETTIAPPAAPAAPSGLSTTNVTETSLALNWVNNELVNPVDGFTVQIATDSGFSVGLQEFTVAGNVTSLDFTGLTPSTTYYFQVNAFNLGGTSAWSAPWTETTLATPATPPAAPSNLSVTNYTLSSLTLAWMDNSSTEDGFRVQIATDKNFTQNFRTVDVAAGVTSYQFTLLAPNTKYYMRVAAFNVAGSSAWSPTLADKTLK